MGFSIGIGLGLIHGTTWPSVILRASIGAYLAGLLMRWWGQVWIKSLQQAHHERRAARTKPALKPAATQAKV